MPTINKDILEGFISPGAVLKGTLYAVAFSLLVSAGAGVVYHFISGSEQTLPWSAAAILALSSFGGSLAAGREAGGRGLYHGLATALLFFLIIWLTAGFFLPGQAVMGIYYKLLVISSAGALGGIVGVGLS